MATPPLLTDTVAIHDGTTSTDAEIEPLAPCHPDNPEQPAPFGYITENVYISPALHVSKERKRAKRMVCDCQFDPEMDEPDEACGETCLNRVLMIECGSRCPCGEYCNNKRFQRADYADVEVFKTEKKGWGLRGCKDIPPGEFVMEYCGEVCTLADFEQRKVEYIKEKRRHYYFMSLRTDEILDATRKGNYSRFINHSCDPNCETQKWTVGGRLRIGFFTIKTVREGDELTFDYKFQRFGDHAQKCYCGSDNCRGYIGQSKQSSNSLKVVGPSARDLGSPRSPREKKGRGRVQRLMSDADSAFEKEVYSIVGSSWRLKDSTQVLALSRIMLQAETVSQRSMLLQVLLSTRDTGCLKKFLSLQGLKLLWSWMIDSGDKDTHDIINFRIQVLRVLDHLPLTTKNQLEENKLLPLVKKWREIPLRKTKTNLSPKGIKDSAAALPKLFPPDDDFEGTVVTEADSGLCDITEGSEVTDSVTAWSNDKMEESSEAEARYLTSDHSQDEWEQGAKRKPQLIFSNDEDEFMGPAMSPDDFSQHETPPSSIHTPIENTQDEEYGESVGDDSERQEFLQTLPEKAYAMQEISQVAKKDEYDRVQDMPPSLEEVLSEDNQLTEPVLTEDESKDIDSSRPNLPLVESAGRETSPSSSPPRGSLLVHSEQQESDREECNMSSSAQRGFQEEKERIVESSQASSSVEDCETQDLMEVSNSTTHMPFGDEQSVDQEFELSLDREPKEQRPLQDTEPEEQVLSEDDTSLRHNHGTLWDVDQDLLRYDHPLFQEGLVQNDQRTLRDTDFFQDDRETLTQNSQITLQDQDNNQGSQGLMLVETEYQDSEEQRTLQDGEYEAYSTSQGEESDEQKYVSLVGQQQPEQRLSLEAEQQQPEGQGLSLEAEQQQPEGQRLSLEAEQQQPEGQGLSLEAEQQQPEGQRLSLEAEQQQPEGRGLSLEAEQQQPEGQGLSLEAEQQQPEGQRLSLEAEQQQPEGQGLSPEAESQQPEECELSLEVKQQQSEGQELLMEAEQQQPEGQGLSLEAEQQHPEGQRLSLEAEHKQSEEQGLPPEAEYPQPVEHALLLEVKQQQPKEQGLSMEVEQQQPKEQRSLEVELQQPKEQGLSMEVEQQPKEQRSLEVELQQPKEQEGLSMEVEQQSEEQKLSPVPVEHQQLTEQGLSLEADQKQSEKQDLSPKGQELSQDEESGGREMLASLARSLIEKWDGLKEVFRIPKRAPVPKSKDQIVDKEDSSNEGAATDGDGSEEGPEPPRKRIRSRKSPERTWSRSRHRSPLFHSRHSSHTHTRSHSRVSRRQAHYTPSTPPQPRTPPLYSTGYSSGASVQNTVIVQHPGPSVYVQQQVFKDSCQTTILPAPYLNTANPSSQYVQVQQNPSVVVPPTQQPVAGITLPSAQQGAGIALPSTQQGTGISLQQGAGMMVPPNQQGVGMTVHPTQQSTGLLLPPTQQGVRLMVPPTQQRVGISLPPTQQGSILPQTQQGSYYQPTLGVTPGSSQQLLPSLQQGASVYNASQPSTLLTQQTGVQQQQQYTGYQTSGFIPQTGTLPSLQTGGLVNQQQYLQYTNSNQAYVSNQSVTTQPKPLLEIKLSSSAALQASALSLAPLPPPPPEENSLNLPRNWKAATDANGKVYYYHTITRKTQWERPTEKDVEGTITMDLGTPEPESGSEHEEVDAVELKGPCTPTDDNQPHTPDETPPLSQLHSTTGPHTPTSSPQPHTPTSPHPHTPTSPHPHTPTSPQPHTPASSVSPHTPSSTNPHSPSGKELDSSAVSEDAPNFTTLEPQSTPYESHSETSPIVIPATSSSPAKSNPPPQLNLSPGSPSVEPQTPELSPDTIDKRHLSFKKHRKSRMKEHSLKEAFRHKVTKLVTHCLDQHRKPDCKYGRITCVEDFKHLARKLSHGLTEKEISRKGGVDKVELTDSVRVKVKEYIRQYMKKFGPIYVRHRSPL